MTSWIKKMEELNRRERNGDRMVFMVCVLCGLIVIFLLFAEVV